MPELGATDDPVALVPGNPGAIEENVRVLRGRAESAIDAGEGLRAIDTGSWTGPAARAFHDKFSYEPAKWLKAGDALDAASVALDGYADTLRWAQRQAAEAIRLWNEGEAATKKARAEYEERVAQLETQNRSRTAHGEAPAPIPSFHDPGEALRQQAREVLGRAREQLSGSGDRTAAVLRTETQGAPEESGWLEDVGEAAGNFFGGVWAAVSGTAQMVWDIIPIQAIWDPQGYTDGLATMAAGLWHSATHPVEFAKSAVAWEMWAEHPARATGQVVGGFALGGIAGKILKGARAGGRADGDDSDTDGDRADQDTDPPREEPELSPEQGVDRASDAITDDDGDLLGSEDSKGVRMISPEQLTEIHTKLYEKLGEPTSSVETPKGKIETWQLGTDPPSNITYRNFSASGGPTVDVNKVEGLQMKRFHVSGE